MAGNKKSAQTGPGDPENAEPSAEKMPDKTAEKPAADESISDESKLLAVLGYVLGIFVAVLIFLLRKDDRFVKFHAAQAILADLAMMVFSIVIFILGFGLMVVFGIITMGIGFILGFWVVWLVMMALGIGAFLLRVFLAWRAFSGERLKLPYIGEHAEKIAMG